MSIEVTNVYKAFGDKVVLDGISFEVREGETLAIIGASGVGKSVLLKMLVRLLRPDAGTVRVDGENLSQLTRDQLFVLRRRIGYVFQFSALFDSMTVADNVAMGLHRLAEDGSAGIDARVEEALALVELEGLGGRLPAELSGGQRKRVGLARAIALRPKYLLYDEPTTGLDPVTTAVIDGLILKMDRELGVTSVVVTHDMASAYRVADRVAMLHEGRIRFTGTPEALRSVRDPVVRAFIEGRPELMEEVS